MARINIEFTLFSAFYSPLISVMSGGFLKAEGLEAEWTVSPPGVSAVKALEEGHADVIQSAPSQAFTSLAKGETPTAIHFAQINEMDGFFITGRAADPEFDWKRLEGSEVILFGGGQPLARAGDRRLDRDARRGVRARPGRLRSHHDRLGVGAHGDNHVDRSLQRSRLRPPPPGDGSGARSTRRGSGHTLGRQPPRQGQALVSSSYSSGTGARVRSQ